MEEQFERIAGAGYDGIETPLFSMADKRKFARLLKEYKLSFVAQAISSLRKDAPLTEHITNLETECQQAAELGAVVIGAHSLRDSMPYNEQCHYFEAALQVEQRIGISIGHETHRGRAMYTPWHTSKLLQKFPELKITADISHWCCVCESLLECEEEHLELAAARTVHIHGRVGYAEGPQVPHPAAPEYREALAMHMDFWKKVSRHNKRRQEPYLYFTPEFGPPDYMHTMPFTRQPAADLWEVCSWMGDTFREAYHKWQ